RFFRMIDDFVGEVRLVVENQRDIVFTGDVFRGNDREFIPRNIAVRTACGSGRLIEGNIFDAAARNRTAHGDAVQHAGETQIVNVKRLAGNLLPAFFAGNGFADEGHEIPAADERGYTRIRLEII